MGVAIKIQISDEPTSEVVHRFRNFGEDIYRALRDSCNVSIHEIDRATTSFMVRDVKAPDVVDVTQIIHRELRRHFFDTTAILTTE